MTRYRKKLVEIEAVQVERMPDGRLATFETPQWFSRAIVDGTIYTNDGVEWFVKTLEGDHHISERDYIIQGVKGELYPCKPDVFEQTYEAVE